MCLIISLLIFVGLFSYACYLPANISLFVVHMCVYLPTNISLFVVHIVVYLPTKIIPAKTL